VADPSFGRLLTDLLLHHTSSVQVLRAVRAGCCQHRLLLLRMLNRFGCSSAVLVQVDEGAAAEMAQALLLPLMILPLPLLLLCGQILLDLV